jgi:uncharacterized OB-fold protein
MKKCICKKNNFMVKETITSSATIDEEGILDVSTSSGEGEVVMIMCNECGKEYLPQDFKNINFG